MEFEFFAVYPGVGGVSGMLSMNVPREILKVFRSVSVFTSLGSRFHNNNIPALTTHIISTHNVVSSGEETFLCVLISSKLDPRGVH